MCIEKAGKGHAVRYDYMKLDEKVRTQIYNEDNNGDLKVWLLLEGSI